VHFPTVTYWRDVTVVVVVVAHVVVCARAVEMFDQVVSTLMRAMMYVRCHMSSYRDALWFSRDFE
jgi:hypothetical protein